MPSIMTVTGKEVYRSEQMQVRLFLWDGGKEGFLGKTTPVVNKATYLQARRGVNKDIGGQWVTAGYAVPENTMLKLFIQKKASSRMVSASTILLVREKAALVNLSIPLLCGSRHTLSEANITGRFDLLSLPDAIVRGYVPAPGTDRFFSDMVARGLFNITVKEAAEEELKTMETKRGTKGNVYSTRSRRRVLGE